MNAIGDFLTKVDDLVWGVPLIVLILAAGIYLTFRLRLLQIVHLPKALRFMFLNEEEGEGEVSSFGALCTALSATIGTGNIVGVATAIGCNSSWWSRCIILDVGCGIFWNGNKVRRRIFGSKIQNN